MIWQLTGPYKFNRLSVGLFAPQRPGVFILGANNHALYVGKSGTNIQVPLLQLLAEGAANLASQFWVQRTDTLAEAYDTECAHYHRYSPRYNERHPDKPDITMFCKICGN
jgi:hypothetical protein